MLQIVQTRILSVVSMYYLAFLSISMAMLGLTAGAILVYLKSRHFEAQDVSSALARVTAAYAVVIISSFLVELASPVPVVPWATVVLVWLKLILVLAAPFVLAGISVSLALTRSPFPVGIVYGVDLLGAASGCLLVLALLNWVDAPSAIFVIAGIAALSAVCFANAAPRAVSRDAILDRRLLRKPGWIAVGAFVLAAVNASTPHGLQPISAKFNVIESRSQHDFEEWNSFSRITVDRSSTAAPFLWGASPTLPTGLLEDRRSLNIDAGAGTVMPRFDGNSESASYLKYDVTNLAYFARHSGRAAIVGVGSGRDLLSAHLFGFRDITGVELNPIFVDLLTDPAKLRGYAGIADLPGVRLIVDDGRSWFARTQEKFDLLQMSMIDTFASTGAGAFSLSENGLYTVEAWRIFLSALAPNGMFTVSRWHSPTAQIELGRVVSLAIAALFSLGVDNPRDHIFLAGADSLATIIISCAAFSPADLELLTDAAFGGNFPGSPVGEGYRRPERARGRLSPRRLRADGLAPLLLQHAPDLASRGCCERHPASPSDPPLPGKRGLPCGRQPHGGWHLADDYPALRGIRARCRGPAGAPRGVQGRSELGRMGDRLFPPDRSGLHVCRNRVDTAHVRIHGAPDIRAQHRAVQHHPVDRRR
jgi:hypothetical protein